MCVCVCVCVCVQVEYKKKYEQTKAQYHVPLDTAEQLHHKENKELHSQVSPHSHSRLFLLTFCLLANEWIVVSVGAGEVQRGVREEQRSLSDGVWRHSDVQSV